MPRRSQSDRMIKLDDGAAAVISALSKNKDTMNDALETLDGWLYSHYN